MGSHDAVGQQRWLSRAAARRTAQHCRHHPRLQRHPILRHRWRHRIRPRRARRTCRRCCRRRSCSSSWCQSWPSCSSPMSYSYPKSCWSPTNHRGRSCCCCRLPQQRWRQTRRPRRGSSGASCREPHGRRHPPARGDRMDRALRWRGRGAHTLHRSPTVDTCGRDFRRFGRSCPGRACLIFSSLSRARN